MIKTMTVCNLCFVESDPNYFKGQGFRYLNSKYEVCGLFDDKVTAHICADCIQSVSNFIFRDVETKKSNEEFQYRPLAQIGSEP